MASAKWTHRCFSQLDFAPNPWHSSKYRGALVADCAERNHLVKLWNKAVLAFSQAVSILKTCRKNDQGFRGATSTDGVGSATRRQRPFHAGDPRTEYGC